MIIGFAQLDLLPGGGFVRLFGDCATAGKPRVKRQNKQIPVWTTERIDRELILHDTFIPRFGQSWTATGHLPMTHSSAATLGAAACGPRA